MTDYDIKKPVISFRTDSTIKNHLKKLAGGKSLQAYLHDIIIEHLKKMGVVEVNYIFKDKQVS